MLRIWKTNLEVMRGVSQRAGYELGHRTLSSHQQGQAHCLYFYDAIAWSVRMLFKTGQPS